MPKFKVVAPVEHDLTLYVPQNATISGTAKSASNGQEIPVNSSGVIELDDARAQALTNRQVVPLPDPADARTDSKQTRRRP